MNANSVAPGAQEKRFAAYLDRLVEHRGVEPTAASWEMSHLGLARAYALQGDAARAACRL